MFHYFNFSSYIRFFVKALNEKNINISNEIIFSGPSCSKLTTSLVNVSLKFQTLISQIHQYFLLKKCEKLLQCKSFSHVFQQKNSVYLVIKL